MGCEHGVGGASTVLLEGAIRTCLMFAVQQDAEIRTVEGLAAPGGDLRPLQEAFIRLHGVQCGFCTPGSLMLAPAIPERHADIAEVDLLGALSSSLGTRTSSRRCARRSPPEAGR
jgi:aerobic carbon-monoxide dehydrogenase small subunit